jgi:adenylate cyclase
MNLLAAPFIVSDDRLGAVVVGRQTAFSLADNRLMHAVISQMDSAIAHARMSYKLGLRNKELETIYRIDHIRDVEADFDAMLQAVLTELCRVISSEMGYIMLYSADKDEHMEMKASTEDGALTSAEHNRIIKRVSREALDSAQLVCHNQPEGPIQSIVAIPLILNERIIGVFGAINSKNKRGFSPDDRRMLAAITSQVDSAVFERLEQRRIRRVLGRSVDPKVLNYLLQHPDDSILEGERVILSILFADLRGSTEWAERIAAEELVATLNLFLSRMTEVIFSYEGTLDKFVGDEIIALFGTPVHLEDHAYRAASTGLAIQVAHQELQAELSAQGKELPSLGVGISSGEVIAGEFGPAIHTDFTAIGRVMNLGSRLCSAAAAGQVIISPETYRLLGDQAHVETSDSLTLKGISEPIPICHLLALRD